MCKAGAPWGILCPLHPLLSWGLCSSWLLAPPPVQPLCRCLYSQLPHPCPWPLLQPVCQPALYSRYNFNHKALYPDQKSNHAHSVQLIFLSSSNSVFRQFRKNSNRPTRRLKWPPFTLQSHKSHHALWLYCCVYRSETDWPSLTATTLSPFSPCLIPALTLCSSPVLTIGLRVLPASWQARGLGGPGKAKRGGGVQRRSCRADAGAYSGPITPCPVCPFIQPGPMLSLLITELNVEHRAERALNGLMLLSVLKLLRTVVHSSFSSYGLWWDNFIKK